MNSHAGVREWARTGVGLYVPNRELVAARGFGHVTVRDERGRVTYQSPFENLIVNAGLNYILGNNISGASLYLAPMGIDQHGSHRVVWSIVSHVE